MSMNDKSSTYKQTLSWKLDITDLLEEFQIDWCTDTSIVYSILEQCYSDEACRQHSTSALAIQDSLYYNLKQTYLPNSKFSDLIISACKSACARVQSYNSSVPAYNERIEKKNQRLIERDNWKFCKPLKKEWGYVSKLTDHGYNLTKNFVHLRGNLLDFNTLYGHIRVLVETPKFWDKYPNKRIYCGRVITRKEHGERRVIVSLTFCVNEKIEYKKIGDESTVTGVDIGIYNLLATDDGQVISAQPLLEHRRRINHNITELKQKSTPSARKRLRAQAKREKRYTTDFCHSSVNKVLNQHPNTAVYVMENLKNLRKNSKGKRVNKMLGEFPFNETQEILIYKSKGEGVHYRKVSPYNTSKDCSFCGHKYDKKTDKNPRHKSQYICPVCGHKEHADVNAAKNIKGKYLDILSRYPQGRVNDPDDTLSSTEENVSRCSATV